MRNEMADNPKDKPALTHASDLETVSAVVRLITSKLTLKDMTMEIVARLGTVLETDEVNVIFYDGVNKELSFLARYFADGSGLEKPEVYPLSDGINSWIIKNRRPLLMTYNTLEECKELGIRHGGKPAKSWLGAPMMYQDNITGVVSVQSYTKTGLYDERSVELLNIVAGQCAVAVENARLFEEVVSREAEKERLYFSLTHDLLSLVNPVSGFAKLIQNMPPDAAPESFSGLLDNVVKSSEKITRFVEDILVYSKIKSGKLVLNIERSDVLHCLESALISCLPETTLRRLGVTLNGVKVTVDTIKTTDNLIADLDVAQIERVFLNLIGNAVKYANSKIDVEAFAEDEKIICRISDDGPGVNESQAASLFDEYYQANKKNKGVGLGLPTVKRIVELHQGSIHAISDEGKGFVIEFSWPRTLADRQGVETDGT